MPAAILALLLDVSAAPASVRALFDARFGPDAPALRDALAARGARVTYLEAPQGHTLGAWPDLTALVLLELLPGPRR